MGIGAAKKELARLDKGVDAGRAEQIVHETRGIGWGFHDDLDGSYMQTYKEA